MASPAEQQQQQTIIETAVIQQDPALHAELEKVTYSILHTAKRSGPAWSVLSTFDARPPFFEALDHLHASNQRPPLTDMTPHTCLQAAAR